MPTAPRTNRNFRHPMELNGRRPAHEFEKKDDMKQTWMGAAALMLPLKTTEVRFVPFDLASQQIAPSVLAKDAPRALFREQQAKADLRKLVAAAETYIPDAFALNFHQVAVMSDPAMQARFADDGRYVFSVIG